LGRTVVGTKPVAEDPEEEKRNDGKHDSEG
jgi:hypothetical protein